MEDLNRLLKVILNGQPSILVEEIYEELCLGGISGLELYPKCTELNGVLHHSARGVWLLQSGPQRHVCQDCIRVGFEIGT